MYCARAIFERGLQFSARKSFEVSIPTKRVNSRQAARPPFLAEKHDFHKTHSFLHETNGLESQTGSHSSMLQYVHSHTCCPKHDSWSASHDRPEATDKHMPCQKKTGALSAVTSHGRRQGKTSTKEMPPRRLNMSVGTLTMPRPLERTHGQWSNHQGLQKHENAPRPYGDSRLVTC